MQIIRRLYFYAVTLVSLETVIWGLIGLMRSVASPPVLGASADRLAAPLAFILVGLPVFLSHWRQVQRMAAQSAEEAVARLRSVFFYLALIATLLPAAQNALAFLSRTFTQAFGLESSSALFGAEQSLVDNGVAIGVNLLLAVYLYRRNRQNWSGEVCDALSEAEKDRLRENYTDTRRVYRIFWLSYSLVLTVLGVRQLLAYLLLSPQSIGAPSAAMLSNGLALLGVGLPVWSYTHLLWNRSPEARGETTSWLRIAFLYIVTWLSMFLTLYQVGKVSEVLFRLLLGATSSTTQALQSLRPALALGIPIGVVWWLYGMQRQAAITQCQPPLLRHALQRFHATIVASAALLAVIIGSSRFLAFVLRWLFDAKSYFSQSGRGELSASLAVLLIAIPVWFGYWRQLQQEAAPEGEQGAHTRRSLVRKGMLYVWIFVGVVGTMFATGSFFFTILRAVLGTPPDNLALESLLSLRLTLIFLAVLIYHLIVLRCDQRLAAAALAARQAAYPVAIGVAQESRLAKELTEALQKEAPHLPVFWLEDNQQVSEQALEQAKALVISTEILEKATADEQKLWQAFAGQRIIIPDPQSEWYWVGGSVQSMSALAKQTARALRLLAEGQPLPRQADNTLLTTLAYVLAALFLLQIGLLTLFSLLAPIMD